MKNCFNSDPQPCRYYKKKARQYFEIQEPRALSKPQQTAKPMLGNPKCVFSAHSGLPVGASVYRKYHNMITCLVCMHTQIGQ